MRTRALVLTLLAVMAALLLAACGDDDSKSDAKSTKTPEGKLSASTAPPKLGYYGGIECGKSECSDTIVTKAREGFLTYCRTGKPNADMDSSFTSDGREFNYVCFTLKSANSLIDFYFADAKIVKSVYVSSDRFPETCDNGYCISGEWFSTKKMSGKIRNPNSVYSFYKAEWISAAS